MNAWLILAIAAGVAATAAIAVVISGTSGPYFAGAATVVDADDQVLTHDEVMDVLDEFEWAYPAAVASLAETEVPGETKEPL